MTRTLNGIHRETAGYSHNWEEALKFTSPDGGETILDTHLRDGENEYHYPQVHRLMGPRFAIHIRMYPEAGWPDPQYHPHWNQLVPLNWARECVRRLSDPRLTWNGVQLLDDPCVIVSFANEQDLACEGHPGAATVALPAVGIAVYRDIWLWNLAVVREFKLLVPDTKVLIATNPLAGGHEPMGSPCDSEYQMPEFKAYLDACDILCTHAYFLRGGWGARPTEEGYWYGQRMLRAPMYRENVGGMPALSGPDPGGVVRQYPGKPWMVGEFGNFRHYDAGGDAVAATLAGYKACYQAFSDAGCLLVTPFLWNCADDDAGNVLNRFRGNIPLVQAMQALYRYPAPELPNKGEGGVPMEMQKHIEDAVIKAKNCEPVPGGLKPVRIIIHCTRSGKDRTPAEELASTESWFTTVGSNASSHLIVGAEGQFVYCVPWDWKAYGAQYLNVESLHIELVQAKSNIPFTEVQLKRAAEALQWLCPRYNIPKVRAWGDAGIGIVGHEDTEQGQQQGKSDPGYLFPWDRFIAMVRGEAVPANPLPADTTTGQMSEIIRQRDAQIAEMKLDVQGLLERWG